MTLEEVMTELEGYGSEQTKKIMLNHGAGSNGFGVKVQDMKKIQKKVKKDYNLSLQLFDTLNYDAMYLAGLISEPDKMTKDNLKDWAHKANSPWVNEYTVAGAAAASPYAYELAMEWIADSDEKIASIGWATLNIWVSITPNDILDLQKIKELLDSLPVNINRAQNRERYTMNGFIISVGCFIPELTEYAKTIALKIGKVKVDMGATACKVPYAIEYIEKHEKSGSIGKKRKGAFC